MHAQVDEALALGRATLAKIKQNLAWAGAWWGHGRVGLFDGRCASYAALHCQASRLLG